MITLVGFPKYLGISLKPVLVRDLEMWIDKPTIELLPDLNVRNKKDWKRYVTITDVDPKQLAKIAHVLSNLAEAINIRFRIECEEHDYYMEFSP